MSSYLLTYSLPLKMSLYVCMYTYTVIFENKLLGLQGESSRCGILKNLSDSEDFQKLIWKDACGTEIKQKPQNIKSPSFYLSFFSSSQF